jgi:hypothetical protein
LISLKKSSYAWIYELLEIFNRGDLAKFEKIAVQHVINNLIQDELNRNQKKL